MTKNESIFVLFLVGLAGVIIYLHSQGRTLSGVANGDPLPSQADTLAMLPQVPAISFKVPQHSGPVAGLYTYNLSDASRIDEPASDTEFLTGFTG